MFVSGRGDYLDYRTGLRPGIQEVPGVGWEGRGDAETNRHITEKSMFHLISTNFAFINDNGTIPQPVQLRSVLVSP